MSEFSDLKTQAENMTAQELLTLLLARRYKGKSLVTASLRSRSIIVLKMVADIDPATPVVFCHASRLYPESRSYRDRVVEMLGLTNVTETHGDQGAVRQSDHDHMECLWVEDEAGGGLVHECVHLNATLADVQCWISAVYSDSPEGRRRTDRIDVNGKILRIDPLCGWTRADGRTFMLEHGLPPHPRASKGNNKTVRESAGDVVSYSF